MSKLAIDGGTPVRTDPWPARLQIDDREINAVMELMQAAKAGGTKTGKSGTGRAGSAAGKRGGRK